MDRGAWQATVQGVTKSWTRLSNEHFHFSAITKIICTDLPPLPLWNSFSELSEVLSPGLQPSFCPK